VSSAALALALGAAVLHATWNLLLARARDVEAATALVLVLSLAMYAPVAAVTWDVDASVWPYVVASAIFELAYIVLLAAAYRRTRLSVVYPVARGLAPVLVLLGALAFLAVTPSAGEAAGVLLVGGGILLVRGLREPDRRGLVFGAAIACCIASYTLVDSRGIDHADPFGYLELVMVVPSIAYFAGVVAAKGIAPVRRELGPATVIAAAATYGAYALVLFALRLAPAAPVAALRETSVVIAVLLAVPLLRERVGPGRIAGAALVAIGVALLSF
jgi:drug/metabolite transporter (DMT)-like permease